MLGEISALITTIFLLIILSYYLLLFLPIKKGKTGKKIRSMLVAVPARNEQSRIGMTLNSIFAAEFDGKKRVIAIDDGSTDGTLKVLKTFKKNGLEIIRTQHKGKAVALNIALSKCKQDAFVVVDADSTINSESLKYMAEILGLEKIGAVTCVVKVKNRKTLIGMWLHLEQIYNSLMRFLLAKVNANIVTPGPLGMYRTDALKKINGFSTLGFSEDIDVTVRLVRAGYRVGFSEKSVSETIMPVSLRGFFSQRSRFARGMINVFAKHLKPGRNLIDLYTLPLFLFAYIQAIVLGSITIFQIVSGYMTWFSIIGFAKWTLGAVVGITPLTFAVIVGILASLLSYPLFIIAILKFDKKIDLWHLIPFLFMFPFWLTIMTVYILNLPEVFRRKQKNIWEKIN